MEKEQTAVEAGEKAEVTGIQRGPMETLFELHLSVWQDLFFI